MLVVATAVKRAESPAPEDELPDELLSWEQATAVQRGMRRANNSQQRDQG